MNINEKIYTLRKERGLSQEELANELNVSRQTVSKWELGESTPDFDKIVPLCELFGISTEELLRDKKIEEECIKDISEETETDVVKAILICISIFLYFFALVSIIIGETALHLNDGVTISIFFLICGLATALIVFTCMTRPSKRKDEDIDGENIKDPILKAVLKIASIITVCLYLIISFITMAWHITWIIFIIYGVVAEIIKLLFLLKKGEKKEDE